MKGRKVDKIINILPLQTQKDFRNALKHRIFTQEAFIPKNFDGIKKDSKNDILRNYLSKFQKIYNKRNKFISDINKDITEFSKGYSGLTLLNEKKNKKRNKIIFGNLIKKYNEKGFETKNLLVNKNLFKKSVLLTDNDFKNILKVNDNTEINNDEKYMNKLDFLLQGNKHFDYYRFQIALSEDEKREKGEYYYPDNYDFKKNNLLLKYDILKTKKTIDDTLSPEPIFSDRTNSNLSNYNPTKSNSETQIKFNTTNDTNFTSKKNKVKSKNGKKILLPKQLLNINKIKSADFDADSNIILDKKKTFKSIISSNDISSRNKSEIKLTAEMKKKIHEDMMNNLSDLYERIKKTNFEESENNILEYCFKYDKKIPEKEK